MLAKQFVGCRVGFEVRKLTQITEGNFEVEPTSCVNIAKFVMIVARSKYLLLNVIYMLLSYGVLNN